MTTALSYSLNSNNSQWQKYEWNLNQAPLKSYFRLKKKNRKPHNTVFLRFPCYFLRFPLIQRFLFRNSSSMLKVFAFIFLHYGQKYRAPVVSMTSSWCGLMIMCGAMWACVCVLGAFWHIYTTLGGISGGRRSGFCKVVGNKSCK